MREIRVSAAVWDAIATRGRFGETEDDVLRRVFSLPPADTPIRLGRIGRGSKRFATKEMRARVEGENLVVTFEDGVRFAERLPNRSDKARIRTLRDAAVRFALQHGATDPGQTNAVRKALTDAGFHLTR
jgi:hypothetical protein